MISNGCVLPNIILKNLAHSEFWFLVSFWLNFNFFIFLQLQQILSILNQGRPWLKFHRIFQVGKKSFFLKNIFFFVFYGCLSFFNWKYRYFATFDQQILSEKLIFRILQHRFSRGSAISKMIVGLSAKSFTGYRCSFTCNSRSAMGGYYFNLDFSQCLRVTTF